MVSPEIIKEIFTERDMRYNIRGQSDLILPNPKTVSFGTESVKDTTRAFLKKK